MLRTWNAYSNAHFFDCKCPKRIAKTLWALAVCAIFGALCGALSGALIGVLFVLLTTREQFSYMGFGLAIGAAFGLVAGFFAGLTGAVIGERRGWLIGGFFGGALVGVWFFPITGIIGAFATRFFYDEVLRRSKDNKLYRGILATYDRSDLGEWRTRKLWIAPVFVFYVLSLFVAFKLLDW